jgi:hypothetical protein
MAGSAADTPTTPEFIRVSDMDRERAVDELKREYVDGRLSHDTFMLRMNAALGARNHGQLSGLFTDLPPRLSRLTRARQAIRRWGLSAREAIEDGLSSYRRDEDHGHDALSQAGPKPLLFPPSQDTSFTIGRDQRCDLYVADMSVSRLHARLARNNEGWLLSDLGSTNGTRVNGWRLRAAVPVQPGDTVTFGSASFVLRDGHLGEGHLGEGHLEG